MERAFGLTTEEACGASRTERRQLVQKTIAYSPVSNALFGLPFAWTRHLADSILANLSTPCKVINGTSH